ncbi:hypothetical protein GCM10007989_17930 [Devosia pacifica]|uniref:DUF1697 domain-containing protein n=1 Tax=Devosia pacifica TaxID=1335967 RepID=A0A918S638_9HYPH|nr:DUF1697 domain-containing protein [Devosia pacifica]GHA22880.1 hypothetical protein GCM10007989_17930 [Devosia pacifica]
MASCYFAFLRGINLGKRRIRMADLKACLEPLGSSDLKTIVASGNVRFNTEQPDNLKARIEAALEERFDYHVGVILRSASQIETMLERHPFASMDQRADAQRFVLLFDEPLPEGLAVAGIDGVFDILRVDQRDIYLAAYRQTNGRYTEGFTSLTRQLDQTLGKARLETMRNFNTIEKAFV